jgi:glucose/arabinose dehydrogenase
MKYNLIFFSLCLVLLVASCQNEIEQAPIDISSPTIAVEESPTSTQPAPTSAIVENGATSTPSPELVATPEAEQVEPTPEVLNPQETEASVVVEMPVENVQLTPVVSGFERPTYLTHAFDDRLFVLEQAGTIRVIREGSVLDEPFLDIQSKVGSSGLEQGLLSVAFHPQYVENGRFFIYFTDREGATIVAGYQVSEGDPNLADPDSEQVFLRIAQPYRNHNGGQLQFGPDGYLYIGMGDGGSAGDPMNNGQNPSTLLGALLRIDVEEDGQYSIPQDNPLADSAENRGEIWAYGLRNPWRFSFDRNNGDLYIADVGQNQLEEVNYQPSSSQGGENYGWNILEGTQCFLQAGCDTTGYTMPVAEYGRQGGNCSVTGGYVYRGEEFPDLRGNYFYGDYCSGVIWSLFHQPDGSWQTNEVLRSGLNISSFGEDVAGEIYVLDHSAGVVYRLVPA